MTAGPWVGQPSREQTLAWSAALTPLVVSLAGNITWGALTGSPILIAAGVVTPLLLVLAIERWRALPPVDREWLRWVRNLAMAGVVVVVAGWSWLHTTALLLGEVAALHPAPATDPLDSVIRGVEVLLCVLAPLAVDGLAVLSVLALSPGRGLAGQRRAAGTATKREQSVDVSAREHAEDPSAGDPADRALPVVAPAGDERAADLIAAGAGRRRLARELDITEYEARQLLARGREEAA